MGTFFNIRYELDKPTVLQRIDDQINNDEVGYVCVADGVILNLVDRLPGYKEVVDEAMFSICDSSYVPLYLRWIYGMDADQYCGIDLFRDIIGKKKYKMAFLGGSEYILDAIKQKLSTEDERADEMLYMELPFCRADEFDYESIARIVNRHKPDIIWVSLGAPKQEIFMNMLKPYLHHGVLIAIGAAFKFYCGKGERRAPQWMINNHLEFFYRIIHSPRKQLNRCAWITRTLPGLLYGEWKRKKEAQRDVATV